MPVRKLTPKQQHAIMRRYLAGESAKILAAEFNITRRYPTALLYRFGRKRDPRFKRLNQRRNWSNQYSTTKGEPPCPATPQSPATAAAE